MKAFISYSHNDEKYLKKLETHLAQIKREGLISSWSDKEITAGTNLTQEIDSQLADSDIFIALLSPDYIASNYCYEKEFEAALQKMDKKELLIVPVICEPCDWLHTPFKDLLATPKDGKPISEWANENTAYISVIDSLRRLTKNLKSSSDLEQEFPLQLSERKNYKVQKDFDSIQKLEFVEKSFKDVVNVLKSYLDEMRSLDNITARILIEENSRFKFILVNRNMILREATLILEFNKDLDPGLQKYNFTYGDGEREFALKVSINSHSYNFDLSHDAYRLYWNKNGLYSESRPYPVKEIADIILADVMKEVGISFDD